MSIIQASKNTYHNVASLNFLIQVTKHWIALMCLLSPIMILVTFFPELGFELKSTDKYPIFNLSVFLYFIYFIVLADLEFLSQLFGISFVGANK